MTDHNEPTIAQRIEALEEAMEYVITDNRTVETGYAACEHLPAVLAELRRLQAAESATTWETDHQRRILEQHGLADEFPWGCDSIDAVAEEIDRLRQKNRELNRRAQHADAAAADAHKCVEKLSSGSPWCSGSLGRALLAWSVSQLQDDNAKLREALQKLLDAQNHYPRADELADAGIAAREALGDHVPTK